MKPQHLISVLLALLAQVSFAQADDVYLCINEGHKEYKNTGGTKGCKKVELPGITTVPASKKTAVASKNASTPADFPKIDGSTQKSRDNDRKQILQDELRAEEKKLAELKKEFNNGEPERHGNEKNAVKYQERIEQMKEDIARTEKNLEALKRETANLK